MALTQESSSNSTASICKSTYTDTCASTYILICKFIATRIFTIKFPSTILLISPLVECNGASILLEESYVCLAQESLVTLSHVSPPLLT